MVIDLYLSQNGFQIILPRRIRFYARSEWCGQNIDCFWLCFFSRLKYLKISQIFIDNRFEIYYILRCLKLIYMHIIKLSSSWVGRVCSLLSAQTNNYNNSGCNLQLFGRRGRYYLLCFLFYLTVSSIAYNKFDRQDLTNHSPPILILIILNFLQHYNSVK